MFTDLLDCEKKRTRKKYCVIYFSFSTDKSVLPQSAEEVILSFCVSAENIPMFQLGCDHILFICQCPQLYLNNMSLVKVIISYS